ncbi:MAG TPA: hypothetical protein VFG10_06440 [Saprospiraceae bacterium]|nr:hypothetical protein [Saprospiraceae bacterium]
MKKIVIISSIIIFTIVGFFILIIYNYLFTPIKSNITYKIDKYHYRFINIYKDRESKLYTIFCYLKHVEKMDNSELIKFITLLNRNPEYDSSFNMKYSFKLAHQIFNNESKYHIELINNNIIDENEKHSFSKTLLIDRNINTFCIHFSANTFSTPDTCITY